MSNDIKVGKIDVNLDTLVGVSRSDVSLMFSHMSEAWRDVLCSHLKFSTPSKVEDDQPKKKKKKTNKGGDE